MMDSASRLDSNEYDKQVSSANNRNFNLFELLVISFMYKRNKRGPNILRCGTPHFKISTSELSHVMLIRH